MTFTSKTLIKTSILLGFTLEHASGTNNYDPGHRGLRGYVTKDHLVTLPPVFDNLSNVNQKLRSHDTPIYWHVLKSGGTTMKHVFGQCMNFVIADEKPHGNENVS